MAKSPAPRPAVTQVTAARQATQVRPLLLGRHDVIAAAGVTYPTIWLWMREGKFPRSRIVGGKSMWLASEIEDWVAALPVRPLKPLGSGSR
jgi:predicted DNA-binding transcriptional regulator AlpA